ncbi:hypothetical protein FACS1894125_7370 [Actinomycetota bacterium]|nr:hypothetical protein FACS1894125_7370 [Actinomycetota bacterium]
MNTKPLNRFADANLIQKVKSNNLTIVTGPSYIGKTTVVQKNLPDWRYVSLTNSYDRMNAFNDPEEYLEWLGNKVIIDDIGYNIKLAELIYSKYKSGQLNQKIVIVCNQQVDSIMDNIDILVPISGLSNRELINSDIFLPSPNPWITKGGDPNLILNTRTIRNPAARGGT